MGVKLKHIDFRQRPIGLNVTQRSVRYTIKQHRASLQEIMHLTAIALHAANRCQHEMAVTRLWCHVARYKR
jgi:hypothetical protein